MIYFYKSLFLITMKRINILLVLLFLPLILNTCEQNTDTTQKTDMGNLPQQKIVDAKINFTEHNTKYATLYAEELMKYESKNITLASKVKINFFDSLGNVRTVLTSDSGRVTNGKEHIKTWGNVKVESKDNVTLWTDSLKWSSKTNLITTEDTVRIKQRGDEIQGVGLVSDVHFNNIRLKKNISGEIHE